MTRNTFVLRTQRELSPEKFRNFRETGRGIACWSSTAPFTRTILRWPIFKRSHLARAFTRVLWLSALIKINCVNICYEGPLLEIEMKEACMTMRYFAGCSSVSCIIISVIGTWSVSWHLAKRVKCFVLFIFAAHRLIATRNCLRMMTITWRGQTHSSTTPGQKDCGSIEIATQMMT